MTDPNQGPAAENPNEAPPRSLGELALIAAATRVVKERVTPHFTANDADAKAALIAAYLGSDGTRSVQAKVDGVPVATLTVSVPKPKFTVSDPDQFLTYADEQGETEIIVRPKPKFQEAVLKRAVLDEETGQVVDKRTGEVIPGVTRIPGGQPSQASLTWNDDGFERLERAMKDGSLRHILGGMPQLPPPHSDDA